MRWILWLGAASKYRKNALKQERSGLELVLTTPFHLIRGPEGSRTLVQLCDKLCFLHAYFPINCRDLAGWKPT